MYCCRICYKKIFKEKEEAKVVGKDEFGLKLIHQNECFDLYLSYCKNESY